MYDTAIDVWIVRDVKKKKFAVEHKLNYLVFWTLDEAASWIKSK